MRKGKPPFDAPAAATDAGSALFNRQPDEADFLVAPSPQRRQLTPRDIARNRGVSRLFSNIIPGLPIDADPPETRQEPEPFSALIEKTLKALKIDDSPWLDELAGAWTRIMPPEVVKSARPGKWDNGTLYVYVDSSPHLFELRRTHLKRIEAAVRAFAGDGRVKHVRLMVNAVTIP